MNHAGILLSMELVLQVGGGSSKRGSEGAGGVGGGTAAEELEGGAVRVMRPRQHPTTASHASKQVTVALCCAKEGKAKIERTKKNHPIPHVRTSKVVISILNGKLRMFSRMIFEHQFCTQG